MLDAESDAVLDRLGVAEAFSNTYDPVGLLGSLGRALAGQVRHPLGLPLRLGRHALGLSEAATASALRALGLEAEGPAQVATKDRRFAEPAWSKNAAFYALLQAYLLTRNLLIDLVEDSGVEGHALAKARFAANLLSDALSPTNYLATNPAALRRAAETGGLSLVRGLRNAFDDLVHNDGWPNQVDTTPFELGRNMGASPGQVVFRNDLIEVLQYQPTTTSHPRDPAANRPSVDQQVLHSRPRAGQEPDRVGGQPRFDGLLHQLPQSRRFDEGFRLRRLSLERPQVRDQCSPRDHRSRNGQHLVGLPGWDPQHRAPRIPERHRRPRAGE